MRIRRRRRPGSCFGDRGHEHRTRGDRRHDQHAGQHADVRLTDERRHHGDERQELGPSAQDRGGHDDQRHRGQHDDVRIPGTRQDRRDAPGVQRHHRHRHDREHAAGGAHHHPREHQHGRQVDGERPGVEAGRQRSAQRIEGCQHIEVERTGMMPSVPRIGTDELRAAAGVRRVALDDRGVRDRRHRLRLTRQRDELHEKERSDDTAADTHGQGRTYDPLCHCASITSIRICALSDCRTPVRCSWRPVPFA